MYSYSLFMNSGLLHDEGKICVFILNKPLLRISIGNTSGFNIRTPTGSKVVGLCHGINKRAHIEERRSIPRNHLDVLHNLL